MRRIEDKNTITKLKRLYQSHGAPWEGINIFGIRNEKDQEKSVWNDTLGLATNECIYIFKGTTDPGSWWTRNHKQGVDHLATGYHPDLWKLGQHKGYPAFVQAGNLVRVWRDENRNYIRDNSESFFKRRWWGINGHRARPKDRKHIKHIGKYSAGCQVWYDTREFKSCRKIAEDSGQEYFSYLLMDLSDTTKQFMV